jgi:hypothetical protein
VSKRVAIVQSSYIPWKGYFDLIRAVDEFVLLDDVQFTRRDWRTRNRIKTPNGLLWLTVPVQSKGRYFQRIQDTLVADDRWWERHWKSLCGSYARAPYFSVYTEPLADLYRPVASEERLSIVNHRFLSGICRLLGITTPITWSSDYDAPPGRNERLVALCERAGASEYLSGPNARSYLDEALFARAGIRVRYADYTGYPEYPQVHPPFAHEVTVLDLLLHAGDDAFRYMKRL